ncbi:MAG: two-component sensor histidine kinase [Chitinophagaceae bacterium]|nr:two-component sensor histidine kinase [Chitinophagaceae bacterium]
MMYRFRFDELKKDDPAYIQKVENINDLKRRKDTQYIGEGSIFLLVILIGAVFVYRATRKQFRLSRQQQNFLMAVTHELKTPIAVTQLNLETLQKRKLDEQQHQKIISQTLEETSRLNELSNNILVSSQLEAGAYELNKQRINLSDLVKQCAANFSQRFPKRNLILSVLENIFCEVDDILFTMLVNNLLENAVKYSPAEKDIQLKLFSKDKKTWLLVADEGPGIPANERKRIFQRFYRIGSENTRKAKGTGLGLYLCKKIAEDHNGRIEVGDHTPNGTVFTVIF